MTKSVWHLWAYFIRRQASGEVVMSVLKLLHEMRVKSGESKTKGLPDEVVTAFLERDSSLREAIELGHAAQSAYRETHREIVEGSEEAAVKALQTDLVNFYAAHCVNPYVAVAAVGPWVVTSHGAVLHDSGGYGMLGFGQGPTAVIEAMARPWVMANVMTPSFSHKRFTDSLKREIGHTRGSCPFSHFLCMNSGSEAVTVAARFSDVNAHRLTAPGARYAGKTPKFLAIEGAFHGRTDRPAQLSDASLPHYRKSLYSFAQRDNLVATPPNDIDALHKAFEEAERDGAFFEAMFLEPVMGEGNPGLSITPEFYAAARAVTRAAGTLLLVDSIQAGIRTHGVLSVVDYPGFQELEAPDMETYSKALNAGQYPLSVLALNESTAATYANGMYGNTMSTNPRALEVACAVLDSITPALRENVSRAGAALVEAFRELQRELPELIQGVQGTGLLMSVALNSERCMVLGVGGVGGVEEYCRVNGIGVIHGGTNALRFTPHFGLQDEEIALIVSVVRDALLAVGGQQSQEMHAVAG
jgi:acetylornithine/succinyldiaminopimelate/putrescine aminotransferase